MKHLKRGHTSPGFCRFSAEKEYFRLDFATPPDIAWVLLGKLVRSSSRSRTPPAMESNADEELHSISPSSPRVGSRARRQDWREIFRSVTCFTLDFFVFRCKSSCFCRWSLKLFFPWQISTHILACESSKQKFPTKLTFQAGWPSGFLWAGPWIHSSKLQLDGVKGVLEVDALRMWVPKRWTSFWRERRRDQRVAELQVETRWLVVGFQREFLVLF